jgi:hypothetical protein
MEESMIFFVSNRSQIALAPIKREYTLSIPRLLGAIALVIALFGLAYGAHALNWDTGQNTLLTMAQSVFGIVVGILTGEATASKELSGPGAS